MNRCWCLLFSLLLCGSVHGATLLERDAKIGALLLRQRELLVQTSKTFEGWALGHLSAAEAGAELKQSLRGQQKLLAEAQNLENKETFELAAVRTLESSQNLLEEAVLFVKQHPQPKRPELVDFGMRHVKQSGQVWRGWLHARRQVQGELLEGVSPGLNAYYSWEAGLLPLLIDESQLAEELQLAVLTQAEAKGLVRRAVALRLRAENLRPPSQLREAQQAFEGQLVSLARLAEAAQLQSEDPSPDSLSRIRRFSRAYTKHDLDFARMRQQVFERLIRGA